jgi:SAM-dependent methyltransferase
LNGPSHTGPRSPDARAIVRAAYSVASTTYRGDDFELGTSSGYAHWLRRLERRIAPGSRVLELGGGNGIPVARELAKRHRVTLVDLSETQIQRARTLVPGAEFLCADVTAVRFEPASFDAVTAFFSIINVPADEQPGLIRNVASWLTPGGHFLAIVGKVKGTWIEERWRGLDGVSMYYSHAGLEASRASMRDAGLEIVEEGTEPENGAPGFAVLICRRASDAGAPDSPGGPAVSTRAT